MKNILEQDPLLKPVQPGKIVEGKIISKTLSAVFLDLQALGTGIIYGKEFQEIKERIKNLKIGDTLFVKVIGLENEDGYVELSLSQASIELTWEKLREKKEKKEPVLIKILGANKGGLLTKFLDIPGFLPISQLSAKHYPRVEKGDVFKVLKELQKFIGKEMEVEIFSLNSKERKIIFSEKSKENKAIKQLLKKYKVGDIVKGEVSGITDFGAFMKIEKENLEGLIHISELAWQIVESPEEIVKLGEKIKAKIISISEARIFLSLKALKKNPWEEIEKKYKPGDIIKGKVIKFNPFGAFIQLTSKIQGLCHISEFGTKSKMETALEIGKKYNFQILLINSKEYRINLKITQETHAENTL